MLNTTVPRLRCPHGRSHKKTCGSELKLEAKSTVPVRGPHVFEVISGSLECPHCKASYPILAGVAVLIEDVRGFLLSHAKGVARVVPEAEFPRPYARELKAALAELRATPSEHIEEDLESERVISLYLTNHYLNASPGTTWWKPSSGEEGSPLIDRLVREHWDRGPLARIEAWVRELNKPARVIELGCGVGGLGARLRAQVGAYLGVDSSFASIALARHLVLGARYPGKIRMPGDLLEGPVSREAPLAPSKDAWGDGSVDFVVGDIDALPVERGSWDLSIALNAIDMLEEPWLLPELQLSLLSSRGQAIQSCPYIWHESVAKKLRARLPKECPRSSSQAVEWLYERAGFEILQREEHLPWLFFKHLRQLEIYSVHLFRGCPASGTPPSRARAPGA